jgi:hypothetical protein
MLQDLHLCFERVYCTAPVWKCTKDVRALGPVVAGRRSGELAAVGCEVRDQTDEQQERPSIARTLEDEPGAYRVACQVADVEVVELERPEWRRAEDVQIRVGRALRGGHTVHRFGWGDGGAHGGVEGRGNPAGALALTARRDRRQEEGRRSAKRSSTTVHCAHSAHERRSVWRATCRTRL